MPKPFEKVRVHVSGYIRLDEIIMGWSDEEKHEIQNYDELAWDNLQEACEQNLEYWISNGMLFLDVDPVDY